MFSAAWKMLKETVLEFINDEALSRGAAIAFYTVTSIAPARCSTICAGAGRQAYTPFMCRMAASALRPKPPSFKGSRFRAGTRVLRSDQE